MPGIENDHRPHQSSSKVNDEGRRQKAVYMTLIVITEVRPRWVDDDDDYNHNDKNNDDDDDDDDDDGGAGDDEVVIAPIVMDNTF